MIPSMTLCLKEMYKIQLLIIFKIGTQRAAMGILHTMQVVNVPSAGEQTVSERPVVGPGGLYLERAKGARYWSTPRKLYQWPPTWRDRPYVSQIQERQQLR